jgi:signal transduction histidine kinase
MECTHDVLSGDRQVARAATQEISEALLANLSIGLVLVDGEGGIRFINPTAERLLQVSRGEVVGKRVYMLPLKTPAYKVLSENCRDCAVEVSIHGLVLKVRATSVICGNGSCLGELYEIRDVTAEHREQRQSDEFVATMTHDLKSPLTVMLGYLDAIAGDPAVQGRERLAACLEDMRRSGHKLLSMIEDILDCYRLDVGLVRIQRDYCDFRKLLEGCCTEMNRDAEAHGLHFSCTIDPAIPVIKVDGKQLSRVFSNIVSNAIKFTPREGSVTVEAALHGNEVLVTIADTGIGISPKDQERIFTKYFRSHKAKGYKGTGLGLTISKAITEEHGGSIEVASREDGGSRFTVRLPVLMDG